MKLKLIMLPEPILVSDENMVIGDIAYSKTFDNICNITKTALRGIEEDNNDEGLFKILAGFSKLPSIDFSALSEEDCKKIGLFNIEALAKEGYKKHVPKHEITFDEEVNRIGGYNVGFKEGFQKAQSLNDKKFTEENMYSMFMAGRDMIDDVTFAFKNSSDALKRLKKSISQPKVFDIEVEMEKDFENHPEMVGNQREEWEYPKIENNKIKITKIH